MVCRRQSSFTWQKTMDVASRREYRRQPERHRQSAGPALEPGGFQCQHSAHLDDELHLPHTRTEGAENLVAREALGGWELSPIITWQSGAPFSIGAGSSQAAYGEVGNGGGCLQFCAGDRADRVPGQSLKVRQGGRSQWIKQYFNPAAFYDPPRWNLRQQRAGPDLRASGLQRGRGLIKNWSIVERYQVQFRFEFFNALNHPIMSTPDTTPTDSTFGEIGGGTGSVANSSRVGQAALKFTF